MDDPDQKMKPAFWIATIEECTKYHVQDIQAKIRSLVKGKWKLVLIEGDMNQALFIVQRNAKYEYCLNPNGSQWKAREALENHYYNDDRGDLGLNSDRR